MEQIKPGPLSGLTVLDFTWVLAGPHATMTFTDLNANVIKVEQYIKGCHERWQPLRVEKDDVTQSSYHIRLNRGKKSLCINLKDPRGIKVIHELIRKSDVLVENFAPGVMGRLTLDYESVKQIKPDIIYCSISCFGQCGPNSNKPGYDVIAQAASGWIGLTKQKLPAPIAIGDTTAAMHACTAILAALYHRMLTGEGQYIDISLVDCLFSLHETAFPSYWTSEAAGKLVLTPDMDQKSSTAAPYGIYKGKNGTIAIAILTQNRWPELVDLMGPKYAWLNKDQRTRDITNRCTPENAPLVHEALESWVMSQDSVEEAERKLEEAGVPCGRVKSITELATTDSNMGDREMRLEKFQPFLGPTKMFGSPLKLSKTPSGIRGYAPFLGEHNAEILSRVLGYEPEQIEDLYRGNVLYHAPEVEKLPEVMKKYEETGK
jgi:CoA:oxalate CoA-transferase